MNLVFVCDSKKIFEGKIDAIIIESDNGPVELLDGHIPAIFAAQHNIKVKHGNTTLSYDFTSGFAYTNGKVCFVIVD